MILLKRLIFAPLFLLLIAYFLHQLSIFFENSFSLIFSLEIASLLQMAVLIFLLFLASLFFIIFAALASDLKTAFSVSLISSAIPFLIFSYPASLLLATGLLISFVVSYLLLSQKLKTYLNFSPIQLFVNPIKQLGKILILAVSITYFFIVSVDTKQNGFSIPDSLIDSTLKLIPQYQAPSQNNAPNLKLSKEQIELLKKNPELLKQSGIDPKILETLDQTSQNQNQNVDVVKEAVKGQIQSFIDPYIQFIPAVLALLLFATFSFLFSLISIMAYPLVWIIFYILEKTKFITFEVETREVKKMVV